MNSIEAKHTPGPWFTADAGGAVAILRADGHPVATTMSTYYWQRMDEALKSTWRGPADARLIAAAPELLAALKNVRARFQHLRLGPDEETVLDRADAAIAKAGARHD